VSGAVSSYNAEISTYLGVSPGEVFLFWKGRIALYAILKAIGVQPGDEVIVPAFTCVVVPSAIKYLGAVPIYADIDSLTYNVDVIKLSSRITRKTKVILAQNTFGLSPDLDPLLLLAEKHGIALVEDCTHGFGGSYNGRKNGTIARASFFSTQWNKPFSTGIGGIAVVRDPRLIEKIRAFTNGIANPSMSERWMLRSLLFARDALLTPKSYWFLANSYRTLSRLNLVVGSSQGAEMKAPLMPADFIKGISEVQAERGAREILRVDEYNRHRKKIAGQYHLLLRELGVRPVFEPVYAVHTFLKYPLLVKDRGTFLENARKAGIELGDWFLSPLHPILGNLALWDYHLGQNPVAEKISSQIVNLPTHPGINAEFVSKLASFLRQNRTHLQPS
jgi:dTDP-4-amino-4,6-dideoxygalactose transaminase